MRAGKFKRKVEEALDKYGDIVVINRIDFWYRENSEGAHNWKVRDTITLSKLLDWGDINIIDSIDGFDARYIVKCLENAETRLPLHVSCTYPDSKERFDKQTEEWDKAHPNARRSIEEASELFHTYYNYATRLYEKW